MYNGDDQRVGQGRGGALTGDLYREASLGSPLRAELMIAGSTDCEKGLHRILLQFQLRIRSEVAQSVMANWQYAPPNK